MRFLFLGLLTILALTGDALSGGVNNPGGGGTGGGYTINWGAGLSVTSGTTGGSCSGPGACGPFATLPLKTYTTATTLLTTDNANLILGNSASALTLTLPSGQATNWASNICDQGAGTLTVAAATGTFYPTASPSLTTGQCIYATFDGTNWAAFIAGGSGGSGNPCTTTALSVQYNNAGAFGCVSGVTSNGTLMTFAAGDLSIAGATSGNLLVECAATCGTNTTVTFPANTGNGVSTTGALTSGDCVQFSGTAGVVADTGSPCGSGGGGPANFGLNSGMVYTSPYLVGAITSAAAAMTTTAGTVYYIPFSATVTHTWTTVNIHWGSTVTGTCDIGYYTNSNGLPTGAANGDTSVTPAASTSTNTTVSWALTANTPYWLAVQCSGGNFMDSVSGATTAWSSVTGYSTSVVGGANNRVSQTGTYGTPGSSLPTAGATASNAITPIWGMKP